MGDSACLLHGFSYASAVPNESKQGNHMHALGESISFGRFTTESLSWDRWSAFPHKKYVEEAERYAQPGSVAQKKAFFEAHYKRIAAQRAAAAALLDQENAITDDRDRDPHPDLVDLGSGNVQIPDGESEIGNKVPKGISGKTSSSVKRIDEVSASESSETSQIEKPLLKHNSVDSEEVSSAVSKRRTELSSLKTLAHHKTRRIPSTPAKAMTPQLKRVHDNGNHNHSHTTRKSNVDEKRSSPTSLRALLSLGSFKESQKEAIFASKRAESSGLAPTSSKTTKDVSTPFKTPAPVKSVSTATPQTEITRMKTPDPYASGRKTTGPKWHLLTAVCSKSLSAYRNKLQSPTVSTPFKLRTEERAAKRKQKLEEKFNATEVQKTQQRTLKEKAGKEFRKLSCSLCFKARPLPDFYKEREPPNNQTKKTPAPQPQTTVQGRSIIKKKHGTISMPPAMSLAKTRVPSISMPPPPPPPTKLSKTRISRNLPRKNDPAHENASPNIQQ